MTGHEMNQWYLRWLQTEPNPYVGSPISWEQYCSENGIPFRDSYVVIANHAQINQLRADRCKKILKQIELL